MISTQKFYNYVRQAYSSKRESLLLPQVFLHLFFFNLTVSNIETLSGPRKKYISLDTRSLLNTSTEKMKNKVTVKTTRNKIRELK